MKLQVVGLAVLLAGQAQAIELLPGGFFAPAEVGSWPEPETHNWLRFGTDYLLFVDRPGEVGVTLTGRQVGKFADLPSLKVSDPAGADVAAVKAGAVGEPATARFTAKVAGPYPVTVQSARNPYELTASGARLLFPIGAGGQELHGVTRSAPVYLFVPAGAKSFTISLSGQGTGESARGELLGPDGKVVVTLDTTDKMIDQHTVTVPPGAAGRVWSLSRLTKAAKGIFEDFGVAVSGDIAPYAAERAADLLCPVLRAESRLVSRAERDPNPAVDVTLYANLADIAGAELSLTVLPAQGRREPLYEDVKTRTTARRLALGPPHRLEPGRYRWELALRQGDREVKRIEGTWWYVPAPKNLTADGGLLVNGQPFFARGLYHVDPKDYELVKAAGFNCVQAHARDVPAAGAAGLKAGVALYWGSRPDSEPWRQKVVELLDHEAVFAWWIQDEPDGQRMSTETLASAYLYLRTTDPNRPAYTCLCVPDRYPEYGPQTDIVSIDVYPVGRGPLTQISDTLDHARATIPNHVRWFIGQVWSWPKGRAVAAAEHRCMTYLALAHGARGLFWYSFRDPDWYLPESNPGVWAACRTVNDELTVLEPALLTPNVGAKVFRLADGQVHACAKRVGDEFTVIAVNPNGTPALVGLALAELGVAAKAKQAEVLFENRTVAVADGVLNDSFEGLAAHVYRLR